MNFGEFFLADLSVSARQQVMNLPLGRPDARQFQRPLSVFDCGGVIAPLKPQAPLLILRVTQTGFGDERSVNQLFAVVIASEREEQSSIGYKHIGELWAALSLQLQPAFISIDCAIGTSQSFKSQGEVKL